MNEENQNQNNNTFTKAAAKQGAKTAASSAAGPVGAALVELLSRTKFGDMILNDVSRKIKIFAVLFLLSIFLIFIIIFTVISAVILQEDNNDSSSSYLSAIYKECKSITVDGKVYSLEDYVAGVVTAENGGAPEESLKAQAVAARTYAISRTNSCKKSIGNSQAFQVFNKNPSDRAKKATEATAGQVLTYNGEIFSTEYDSFYKCGDYKCNNGKCSVTYTKKPNSEKNIVTLPSSWIPNGNGCNGHGRGMSQIAANYMAKEQGKKYDAILKYFYSNGVQISTLTEESSTGGTEEHNKATFTSSSGKKYNNYKQADYAKLKSAGCYITSVAILASGNNSSVKPMDVYNKNGGVSVLGSTVTHFLKKSTVTSVAESKTVSKKLIEFKSNLKAGVTYIIEFNTSWGNKGTCKQTNWTPSTHFVSVLDYRDSDNKVYVSNPGSKQASKTGWLPIENIECARIRVKNP